jgi:SSS family solute:Na+ symporter
MIVFPILKLIPPVEMSVWWIVVGALIGCWFLGVAAFLYRRLSVHYELTTQRFIHSRGILVRTVDRIDVIEIDDVSYVQGIVQRMLGAASLTEARRGTIAAAFLKLLPVFIFIIPGIICFALAASGKMPVISQALLDENGVLIKANAQQAFPLLVAHILPSGIRGIVVAGLLAALMSSLAGVFNASSTLFTMDLYSKFKPDASEKSLVRVGQIATAVMVVIGLLWIPVIQGSRGLYDYLQSVQGYLAPPIFVVFFFGIFNKRMNAQGALAALIIGFIMGLFRLAVDTPVMLYHGFSYSTGSFLWIVNNFFFQYYSLLILIVSGLVMVLVSYATPAPDYASFAGLTMDTVNEKQQLETRSSYNKTDIAATILVLILIVAAYLYFNG